MTVATIEKCLQWEARLESKGYSKHPHPSFKSMEGWFLLVKPGHHSYSILWGDKLAAARVSYETTTTPIPSGSSIFWRMDSDLSDIIPKAPAAPAPQVTTSTARRKRPK